MRNIHYRNIGYPKTGTTWLYWQFISHPIIDGKVNLIHKEFYGSSLENYRKLYDNYQISFNLNTHIFTNNNESNRFDSPININTHTTHISFTFRNLYEVLTSMFNMEKSRNVNFKETEQSYLQRYLTAYCDTKTIFKNWKECKLPIKYLFYDDLQQDAKNYLHSIYDHLEIPKYYDQKTGIKLPTNITEKLKFDDERVIKYINEGISVIEDNTKRDLTHWKK